MLNSIQPSYTNNYDYGRIRLEGKIQPAEMNRLRKLQNPRNIISAMMIVTPIASLSHEQYISPTTTLTNLGPCIKTHNWARKEKIDETFSIDTNDIIVENDSLYRIFNEDLFELDFINENPLTHHLMDEWENNAKYIPPSFSTLEDYEESPSQSFRYDSQEWFYEDNKNDQVSLEPELPHPHSSPPTDIPPTPPPPPLQ